MATPSDLAVALAVAVPESAVEGLATTSDGSFAAAAAEEIGERVAGVRGLLIGPGMTDPDSARVIVEAALAALPGDAVAVLDAMAVTCGAVTAGALEGIGDRVVLTPSGAEMQRLLGDQGGDARDARDAGDADPVDLARRVSDQLGAVIAYSGVVAGPGRAGLGR